MQNRDDVRLLLGGVSSPVCSSRLGNSGHPAHIFEPQQMTEVDALEPPD
jgi:hypothetical protein